MTYQTKGIICAFCDKVRIWPTMSEEYGGAWLERNGQRHYPRCEAWQAATDWQPDTQPANVRS